MGYLRRAAVAVLVPGALAASALAASAAGAAVVSTHTSQNLAGYSLQGNGGDRFRDLRQVVTIPAFTSAVAPQTVVDGMTQAASVNGGVENGMGFVLDASAGVCNSDQATLEYAADVVVGSPMPIPPADLSVLLDGGAPVCLNPGQSWYNEIYYNASSHFVHFQAGPSSGDQDTLADVPDGGYHNFFSGGFGIDTTSGTGASELTTGSAGSFGTVAVTQYNGVKHSLSSLNSGKWVGTVSGGAPSVANPVTLTPSALGSGFGVTAP